MGDHDSPAIRAIFGAVSILMGAVVLGAQAGVVPTDGGRFLAPPVVIASLGAGLALFGAAIALPRSSPAGLRSGLFIVLLILVAVVCNWTAFAPGVRYTSQTTIGPWSSSGQDPIGGRIAFGLAALVVDGLLVFTLYQALRRRGPP